MKDLQSLEELFSKRIFRIPDYQRGYSWTKQQLEEFWGDVLNLLPGRDHYTGMISLKKLDKKSIIDDKKWNDERWLLNTQNYNVCHVVDGQQRLTTFIILINEIVSFYKKENSNKDIDRIYINSKSLKSIKEEFLSITRPDSDDIIKTYKFGYEVDNPSYEFFKNKILNDSDSSPSTETFYTLNLENAKKFFQKKIQEEYDGNGIGSIENIYRKITQNLKFNLYDIDDDFNVYVAFETMNNRGKKLSNLELLKNRLIYLSSIFNDAEDKKFAIRKEINDTWKNVYEYLGKNKNKPLSDDDFLRDHWIIYFGYTRSNKVTYDSFLLGEYFNQNRISNKSVIKLEEEYNNVISIEDIDVSETEEDQALIENKTEILTLGNIYDYIKSMKSIIPFWYRAQNPDEYDKSSEVREMLQKLNRLQFVYFKPLIAVLLSKNNITEADKANTLKKIERYIFLHFRLVNYLSTYRNSFFWNYAHKFYIDEINLKEVNEELSKIDYLSANKVADMKVILNNINRLFKNYKGYYSWSAKTYFLYEYELYLMNNEANQKIYPNNLFKKDDKDKVSIEHIYPQTGTEEYWKERFDNYSIDNRKYLNGTLGNLLPLSLSINVKLQNYSFDDKKIGTDRTRGYENGSHSEMEVAKCEEWTPKEILERGLKLISFMEERYDFIVPNKAERIKMLGLDFMVNEEDENTDKTEAIYKKDRDAENDNNLPKDRHHFKDIRFESSLTGKSYYSKTRNNGTLGIYEQGTNKEVLDNSNPSKKQILLYAVKDLNGKVDNDDTLYQLQHKLEKLLGTI